MRTLQSNEDSSFQSILEVCRDLQSKERTHGLIEWLSGSNPPDNWRRGSRAETSISILNSLRDSCRPFLASSSSSVGSYAPVKITESYESAFPSLGSVKVSPKVAVEFSPQVKQKRRVRPVIVTSNTTSSVWGKGNLVGLENSAAAPVLPTGQAKKSISTITCSPGKADFAKPQTVSTPKKRLAFSCTEKEEGVSRFVDLNNLVDLYCTLVEKCLVPSTTCELNLLFRMLAVPSESNPYGVTEAYGLASILSSGSRLLYFAVSVLKRLSGFILCLGKPVLELISACALFQKVIPEVVKEVDFLLSAYGDDVTFDLTEIASRTPQLTLPFDEKRDSRHNYKTRNEQILYKNREETRDAFLFQLRSFLNVKGKIMDHTQSEKAIDKIRRGARILIDGVKDVNRVWFATFFTDMLLQLGLVPLQEMDQDILKIDDKDKVQKLHKRFSSKSETTSNSTKTLTASRAVKSISPVAAAQQLFTGHQEFFFMFIMSADSYVFGLHLQVALIDWLQNLDFENEKVMARNVLQSRMVARFLGVLIFSPRWLSSHAGKEDCAKKRSCPFHELSALGLSITVTIEKSCSEGKLVTAIPWIAEFLRMSTWDISGRSAPVYNEVMRNLRGILTTLNEYRGRSSMVQGILRGCLEVLFEETFGAQRSYDISVSREVKLPEDSMDNLESQSCGNTTEILQSVDPHLDELVSAVRKLSRPGESSLESPGISRRLRPSFVSPEIATEESPPESGSCRQKAPLSEESRVHARLRDTFFHSQPGLRKIVQFSSERLFKKIVDDMVVRVLRPRLLLDPEDSIPLKTLCTEFIEEEMEKGLRASLTTLAESEIATGTLDVVCRLGAIDAVAASSKRVDVMIATEVTASSQENASRKLFDDHTNSSSSLRSLALQLQHLCEKYVGTNDAGDLAQTTRKVFRSLDDYASTDSVSLAPEADIRLFMQAVLDLDQQAVSMLNWAQSSENTESRTLCLLAFLRLACSIRKVCSRGLHSFTDRIIVVDFLGNLHKFASNHGLVSDFFDVLDEMLKAKIILRGEKESFRRVSPFVESGA